MGVIQQAAQGSPTLRAIRSAAVAEWGLDSGGSRVKLQVSVWQGRWPLHG